MCATPPLKVLLFAGVLALACGEGAPNGSSAAAGGVSDGAAAQPEESSPEETFARGLDYHISGVEMGDPPGTVFFEKSLPITFRYARRTGAAPDPVELLVEAEMGAGSVINTAAPVTMPSASEGEASAEIPQPLSMILGVPGAEASARARLVSATSRTEVSNTVTVPYRVLEAP